MKRTWDPLRRRRFGVRQLAAALVRPACRPYTTLGWRLGASKLAEEKRQQAAALQSCASNRGLCLPRGFVTQAPLGKGAASSRSEAPGAMADAQ